MRTRRRSCPAEVSACSNSSAAARASRRTASRLWLPTSPLSMASVRATSHGDWTGWSSGSRRWRPVCWAAVPSFGQGASTVSILGCHCPCPQRLRHRTHRLVHKHREECRTNSRWSLPPSLLCWRRLQLCQQGLVEGGSSLARLAMNRSHRLTWSRMPEQSSSRCRFKGRRASPPGVCSGTGSVSTRSGVLSREWFLTVQSAHGIRNGLSEVRRYCSAGTSWLS
mmetsp:Transcript_33134/g.76550  ORF Transcript_33134/g.76550 Transcript_33134/m.76550 type:complete len:224 (+) Transcript_33134:257-928(+)